MKEKSTPLPIGELCRKYKDAPYHQIVYYHLQAGNLKGIRQGRWYFAYETDFLEWRERYLAGEYKPGPRIKWIEPEESKETKETQE
jgi:hypothetical protein